MKVLDQHIGNNFAFYHGDSCEVMKGLPDDYIDYSIFSPPFIDLYTYSDDVRDLSNNRDPEEFWLQFAIIIMELKRILKPGRLVSIHCMDLPTMKYKDGFIGLKDFPGEITKLLQDNGFIYHSKVTIWKDPVVAMQRTKALGLLHKQIKKDSSMSRQGVADYIITFRNGKGDNQVPITHTNETFPVDKWQEVASPVWVENEFGEIIPEPVWMDIKQSNTLQKKSARDDKDEKHISPLQLDVIERCIDLWTNENESVFTPFGGIGSEGYQAVKMNRKAVLIELKESYYQQGVQNLINAETSPEQISLFEVRDDELSRIA